MKTSDHGHTLFRLILVAVIATPWGTPVTALADDAIAAFPGAEGFGSQTPGGRGGKVIEVTNLNDDGPGSLRAAIAAEGPRMIVFRVGGTIELKSPLQVENPFVTIAGQSAPGGGITLKNGPTNLYAPLQVKSHDVVIRHIRSRPGPSAVPPPDHEGSNVDAITIADLEREVFNVVIDHCSFSWSVDEVVNSWYDARDITVQWCIMAEGLHNPKDRKGSGSKGPLFGGKGSDRISVHHNLIAHNVGRNPMVKATGLVDLVNNVIFVPAAIATVVDGELGACHVNLIGNYVLAPHGDGLVYGVRVLGRLPVSLFVQGNLGPYRTREDQPESLFVAPQNGGHSRIVERRRDAPPVATISAAEAYRQVLESAGCTLPVRDGVDQRIVADVKAKRTRIVSEPAEVGGWPELPSGTPPADSDHDGMPDEWERRNQLQANSPGDASADVDRDGYTNIEEFLNGTDPQEQRSIPDEPWKRHTIDDTSRGADGVRIADVNHDGLPDLVTGWEEGAVTRVYLHPGHTSVTGPWPAVTVGQTPNVEDAVFVDLDADGRMEVVSSCEGRTRTVFVHWAPRQQSDYLLPDAWKTEPIPASHGRMMWMFCVPGDIDGRNGVDLVAGGKGEGAEIGWFESPEDSRELAHWRWHPISPAGWIMSLWILDMDGDGDPDVLTSDRKGPLRGCRWLQNPGPDRAAAGPWPNHFLGGRDNEVMFMTLADLDADGNPDAIAATRDDGLLVFRRPAVEQSGWRCSSIPLPANTGTGKGIAAGDLDGNGSLDLVVTCENAGDGRSGVVWLSAGNVSWDRSTAHDISGPEGFKLDRVELIDLDGDGDLDVLTCEESEPVGGRRKGLGVLWYENPTRRNLAARRER